jgi:hypothetical protein
VVVIHGSVSSIVQCSWQLVLAANTTHTPLHAQLYMYIARHQIEELVTEVISGVSTPPRQSTARTRQKALFTAANPELAPYYTPALYDGFSALLSSARAAAAAAAAAAVSSDSGNSDREVVTDSSATDVTANVSADVASMYEQEQAAPTTTVPGETAAAAGSSVSITTAGDAADAATTVDSNSAAVGIATEDIEGKSTVIHILLLQSAAHFCL